MIRFCCLCVPEPVSAPRRVSATKRSLPATQQGVMAVSARDISAHVHIKSRSTNGLQYTVRLMYSLLFGKLELIRMEWERYHLQDRAE